MSGGNIDKDGDCTLPQTPPSTLPFDAICHLFAPLPRLSDFDPLFAAAAEHRNVSTAGLLLIAFFWVVGGIYGNEPLLSAGPPAYVFGLLIVCALAYALPMSLISAELACALPYDGGLVAWVDEVCGKTIGAHNMYWLWLSYIFDSCAYPVLASSYVGSIQQLDLALLGGNEETGDTRYIVKASSIFFFFSMTPAVIFMVYGSKDLKPSVLTDTTISDETGGLQPATLFSWISWLYCGYNSLGALAGEVKNPAATYPIVIAWLIPISVITVGWPLAVSISVDPNRTNYVPGHFNDVAAEECGEWLKYGFLIGAAFSFVGLYNAQIIVCERSVASAFEPMIKRYLAKRTRGPIVRYLLTENGTGVAPIFIISNALLAAVLVWLPYDALIELAMLVMSFNMFLFMYAFLWYKWNRPKMERPFNIPGGFIGGLIVVFPCLAMTGVTTYFAAVDPEPIFGMPYGKAIGFAGVVGAGFVAHFFWYLLRQCLGLDLDIADNDGETSPLLQGGDRAQLHGVSVQQPEVDAAQ